MLTNRNENVISTQLDIRPFKMHRDFRSICDGSDIGSPGVDGPPIMPEDPYAYIMAAYQVPSIALLHYLARGSHSTIPTGIVLGVDVPICNMPQEDGDTPGRGAATTCCCLTHCRFHQGDMFLSLIWRRSRGGGRADPEGFRCYPVMIGMMMMDEEEERSLPGDDAMMRTEERM
ncbi:hypothetical protein Tco_1214121 [Tanacetum coccineum]